MFNKTTILAAVVAGFALTGAVRADDVTARTVVATVDGHDITLGELIIARQQLPQQYQALPNDVLFDALVEQLIRQQLLSDTLGEEEPLELQLARANLDRSLRSGYAVDAVTAAALTDEAIQAEYDAQMVSFEPATEYHAAHILVDTEEEAKAVEDRLAAGEAFADIAKELSKDPGSGANGGDLGWFGLGMMVQPFEDAVVELQPGQTSAPVQTQFGWHVIQLAETRQQEAPTLDSIRADIITKLQNEAINAKIEELTAAATITRPEAGAFDPALIANVDLLKE